MIALSTTTGIIAASLHASLCAAPTSAGVPVSAQGTTVSEGPAMPPPSAHTIDTTDEQKPDRGRRLLISGGVVGGLGLLSMTVGFGVLGGIHLGNPGPRMVLEFDDLDQGRRVLRTANTMAIVGVVGAVMSFSGVILGTVGGTMRWCGKRARLSGMLGPGSAGLSLRF